MRNAPLVCSHIALFCETIYSFCVNDHPVMYTTQAVVKIKPEKITGLNLDTAITCAVLSPVNYPSQLADGHL